MKTYVFQAAHWVEVVFTTNTAVSNSTATTPPLDCHYSGTHVLNEKVRYQDGMIAAYCEHCGTRAIIPFQTGGLDSVRLKDLAADLMVSLDGEDGTDPELLDRFYQCFVQLQEHYLEMQSALNQARIAKSVILNRYS